LFLEVAIASFLQHRDLIFQLFHHLVDLWCLFNLRLWRTSYWLRDNCGLWLVLSFLYNGYFFFFKLCLSSADALHFRQCSVLVRGLVLNAFVLLDVL
jgi:hypothetical protein